MSTARWNVLVLSGGGFQGLTLIKALRVSEQVRLFLADCYAENIGKYFVDRFFLVPRIVEEAGFLQCLMAICQEHAIDVMFPSTDFELLFLADHAPAFTSIKTQVAVSALEFLQIAQDKHALSTWLQKEGLPTLPVLNIHEPNLPFPLIGKPRAGWGGRGHVIVSSGAELDAYANEPKSADYIWQQLLHDFEEFSIDFAIGFDGSCSPIVIRKRVRTSGGFAVIAESATDDMLHQLTLEFVSHAARRGAKGIFNIQFLRDSVGYYLTDVNSRIGTSAVFAQGVGVNLPLFVCQSIVPDEAPVRTLRYPQTTSPMKMVRYLEELWLPQLSLDEVRCVVCDLDDTLLNQKKWILGKAECLWETHSAFLPPREYFLLETVQLLEEGHRSDLFDKLGLTFGWEEDFKQQLIEDYRLIEPQVNCLYPETEDVLQSLREAGFRLVLLTDNPVRSQQQKLAVCKLTHQFDEIVFAREIGPEKPDLAVFAELQRRTGLPLSVMVMVGDHLYRDVMGSLQAGFAHAFWVCRPGSMFNFQEYLLSYIGNLSSKYTKLQNLRELSWFLPNRIAGTRN